MSEQNNHIIDELKSTEIVPGFHGRFVHTEGLTLAYWTIETGASLPEHAHHHEQVIHLMEGEFELTIEGKSHILTPGMVYTIPSNVAHAGRCISSCKLLDIFRPIREDFPK